MRKLILSLFIALVFGTACQITAYDEEPQEEKWSSRKADVSGFDSLDSGSTYLAVYAHIYSFSQHSTHNLTATISLRNTDLNEKIYLLKADYFNTEGELVKSYLESPVYIKPMETLEIMIFEGDDHGGTGGNFIFDWLKPEHAKKPYFEAAMISTSGQQGLSFLTRGIDL